jgi:UDP-N-acetylmuramoyl-tripeptide--D-alanyl-D-alanine ligase
VNAIALTADSVAAAAGGVIASGQPGRTFEGVSIDTRTLKPGELFFAVRGDRFDGAQFAAAAIDAGAGGVVVPQGWSAGAGSASLSGERPLAAVIEVADTTIALQSLARAIRRESGAK